MGEILCQTSEFVIQINNIKKIVKMGVTFDVIVNHSSTNVNISPLQKTIDLWRQHIKFVNVKITVLRSTNLSFILHVYNTMLGHKSDLHVHPMRNKTKSNYFYTENINTNVHLQVLQNQDKSNDNNNDRQHIYPVFGSVE